MVDWRYTVGTVAKGEERKQQASEAGPGLLIYYRCFSSSVHPQQPALSPGAIETERAREREKERKKSALAMSAAAGAEEATKATAGLKVKAGQLYTDDEDVKPFGFKVRRVCCLEW